MYVLIILFAGIAAWAAQAGVFYQTGSHWFEACWNKQRASREVPQPLASNFQEAIAWEKCEPAARAAIYNEGIQFLYTRNTIISINDALILDKHCPSAWSISEVGWYANIVFLLEKRGGPNLFETFLPAGFMLGNVISEAWPNCRTATENLGYSMTRQKNAWKFINSVNDDVQKIDNKTITIPMDVLEYLEMYDAIDEE